MYSTTQHTAHIQAEIQVAQNHCYDLLYNPSKNRIYITIKGFWRNVEQVPGFLSDIEKALALVQPGFTLLADLRQMITHAPAVMNLHVQCQKLVKDAGLQAAANVEPSDRIATLQVNEISNQSKMPLFRFTSLQQAEEYLNTFLG